MKITKKKNEQSPESELIHQYAGKGKHAPLEPMS